MGSMSDRVHDLLAKMAEATGLKASDAQRLEGFRKKLGEKKTGNTYQVEKIKDEIRPLRAAPSKRRRSLMKFVVASRTFSKVRLSGLSAILTVSTASGQSSSETSTRFLRSRPSWPN